MHRGPRPYSRLGRLAAVGGSVLILSSLFLSVGAAVASAADTGAKAPTDTVAPNGWTDPTNVFTNDATVATASGDNVDQGYRAFGFGVPNGSIIDGITVAVTARPRIRPAARSRSASRTTTAPASRPARRRS